MIACWRLGGVFLVQLLFVCCCLGFVVVYFGVFALCLSLFWVVVVTLVLVAGCLLLGLVASWGCVDLLDIYFGVFIVGGFACLCC